MWTQVTQWSLYICKNKYKSLLWGPTLFNWRLLWPQLPLSSSATQLLYPLSWSFFSLFKEAKRCLCQLLGEWVEPNETTTKKVWASFNILYSLHGKIYVSQCVKALLWGLVRVCLLNIVLVRCILHRLDHRGTCMAAATGDTAIQY